MAVALAACSSTAAQGPAPAAFQLTDSTVIVDSRTGAPLPAAELLRRAQAADYVLLGEYHDNARDHEVRGRLLRALAARKPGVVFEQFTWNDSTMARPAAVDTTWLDAHGFDRKGWRWPLHEPVVDAAVAVGRELRGSGVKREVLRAVVRNGIATAPAPLADLVTRYPLDSVQRKTIDDELLASHCGQLPLTMVPGMRAMQELRDAAMTNALLSAGATGPAWLIAGNGHVRRDIGVPRMLSKAAAGKQLLVVGLLERDSTGAMPSAEERQLYDVVLVTPRAPREDPCASFGR
ncbi:MAG: ChaN family lipoprotein [Gemmatimonadetes bacterium]|nr:ChaN family lipoprotein [Gemmatimonadota bacterium]